MRKILTSAALLFTTIIIVSACSSNSHKKSQNQTARINIQSEPQSLDPRKARSLADMNVMRMFMDGLTRADQSGTHQLALAEKITISEDSKTYTFTLKDAQWSNGDAVTSHDFVYAWKQSLSPAFPAPNAAQLYPIKNAQSIKEGKLPISLLGVDTPDDKTLVVELNYPAPYFLELTSQPIFFAVNAKVDQLDPRWAESVDTYVGNGPFQLQEWKHHNQITAVKNPSYWDEKTVHLNNVEMAMVTEETGLKMFEQRELHWEGSPYSTIPLDAIENLKASNALKTNPFLATYMIRINIQREPFNHPNIRKAFALAVNRQEIVDYVTQGNQIPATGLVPPTLGLQKGPYFFDANQEKAILLFETALEENTIVYEELPQITLSYVTGERNHQIAQAIQHQWYETFGIEVKLTPVESKVYYSQLSTQDYQLAYGSWVADFGDPINFLEVFKTEFNGTNNTHWENPKFVKALDKSYFFRDNEKRLEVLRQGEAIMMEDMPVIPIFHNTMLHVQDQNLKDVVLLSTGVIDFKWAYFDKD